MFFFFNDTATTEIYTLSLHDALPILVAAGADVPRLGDELDLAHHRVLVDDVEEGRQPVDVVHRAGERAGQVRSEEHTSELQSRQYLVCRLLLEKKNIQQNHYSSTCLP